MPPCSVPIGFACCGAASSSNTVRAALDADEAEADQRGHGRRLDLSRDHRLQQVESRHGRRTVRIASPSPHRVEGRLHSSSASSASPSRPGRAPPSSATARGAGSPRPAGGRRRARRGSSRDGRTACPRSSCALASRPRMPIITPCRRARAGRRPAPWSPPVRRRRRRNPSAPPARAEFVAPNRRASSSLLGSTSIATISPARRAVRPGSLRSRRPAAHHRHTRAGPDAGRVQHRADAGHDRAAEQARLLGRQLLRNLDRGRCRGRPCASRTCRLTNACATARRRPLRDSRASPRRALQSARPAAQAPAAPAARRAPPEDDVVAARGVLDALAGRLDDPDALVAEQDRAGVPQPVSSMCRSVWQTPVASIRTCTSPGPGGSSRSRSSAALAPARLGRRRDP